MRTPFQRSTLGLALILALVVLQSGFTGTHAQDAPSQIGPLIPPASACTGEPRTGEELAALFASATPADPTMGATTATIAIGEPAGAASAQHVTELIYHAIACLNAGDFGRFFALLTDHAIVTIFPWVGEELANEEFAAQLATPTPPPTELLTTILGIGSISQLPDGSFSAVLVQIDPNAGEQPSALILYAVEEHGVWLIDNAIDFDGAE